jgi:hypothetical protein
MIMGSFMPHFSRSFQTGHSGVHSFEGAATATLRLLQSPDFPSAVILPLISE